MDTLELYLKAKDKFKKAIEAEQATLKMLEVKYEHLPNEETREVEARLATLQLEQAKLALEVL